MPSVPDYFDCFWHVAPHRENSHGPGESFILTQAINLTQTNSVRENLENRQNLGFHGISNFLSQPSPSMESEDWLRNCGPYSKIGRHDHSVTRRLILIQSWWSDGREMGPWEGDICFRSRGYNADATNDNIDTNDISWDVDTTASYCHYRFLASLIWL